jgi:hypothetical protein
MPLSLHQSQEPGPSPSLPKGSCAEVQQFVGEHRLPAVEGAYRAMQAAFIRWHVTGCFAAAADYQKARQAWELALMDQPTGDAE